MPTSIIAAVVASAAASSAVGAWASIMVGAAWGGAVVGAVAGMATTSLIGATFSDTPDSPSSSGFEQQLRDNLVTVRQPITHWRYIYGRCKVGGALTFAHETADDNFHLVITFAGHVCQEIEAIHFNDEVVPLDGSGNATGKYAGYVRIKKSLGGEVGQPFPDLVAESEGKWTDAHRQSGRTKIYVRLTKNIDLFPTGLPNITAVIKGKLVYDPRTGLTAYSSNASLCQADFLCDPYAGLADVYADEIDSAQLIAAANIDDEAVTLSAGGTEPRYTLNGTFEVNATPNDVLGRMLTANSGKVRYIGGLFRIEPAAYVIPTITLSEDDLRGVPQISPRLSASDLANGVKGIYVSEINSWQATDFPPVTNATYLAEDGGERSWRELDLPFTKSAATGQRISKIELERIRQQISVEWPGKFNCYRLQPGNTVMINFAMLGWSGKVFEVVQSGLTFENNALGCNLSLRETAPTVFDWNSGNETIVDPAPDTNLPNPFTARPPGYPTLTETLYSSPGGIKSRMNLTWAVSNDAFTRYYQAEYKLTTESSWNTLLTMSNSAFVDDVAPGKYDLRVKAINGLMVSSTYSTNQGDIAGPAGITLANVQNVISFFQDGITTLAWGAVSDIRPIDYEIRVGSTWQSAQVLGRTPLNRFPTVGNGTYWVAAHYSAQNSLNVYSAAPTSIVIAGGTLTRNVIATYDEASLGWPGTLSGGAVIQSGNIMLMGAGNILTCPNILAEPDILWYGGVATSGEYDPPAGHSVNIGRVAPCNVMIGYTVRGQSIYDNVLTMPDVLSVTDLLGELLGVKVGAQPQIALAQADGIYGAWQNFIPGTYSAQYFKARLLLTSSDPQVTAILSGLTFMVDVPDRIAEENVQVAAGGMSVVYSPAFNGGAGGNPVPLPQITILNAVAGDDVILSAQTLSGFTAQVVNSGAGVMRNINYKSQGY